jgi:hypothetical protein
VLSFLPNNHSIGLYLQSTPSRKKSEITMKRLALGLRESRGPLLSAHPRLKSFRFHPTLYVEEMETLFDGRMATEEEAAGIPQSASQITRDDESRLDPPGYRQSAEGTGFPNTDDPIDPELTFDQPQPQTQPPTQPPTQPQPQPHTAMILSYDSTLRTMLPKGRRAIESNDYTSYGSDAEMKF